MISGTTRYIFKRVFIMARVTRYHNAKRLHWHNTLYVIMEMFSEYEQEEIIEEFLDIIILKDLKLELIDEKKCCNCKN